mmetsp:Transcript_42013/g.135078  ORF Transcript_42013/g.135078 Transcript_42013/m.135078 type:complete len:475 (-) Transcript_42013:1328-2752(-)
MHRASPQRLAVRADDGAEVGGVRVELLARLLLAADDPLRGAAHRTRRLCRHLHLVAARRVQREAQLPIVEGAEPEVAVLPRRPQLGHPHVHALHLCRLSLASLAREPREQQQRLGERALRVGLELGALLPQPRERVVRAAGRPVHLCALDGGESRVVEARLRERVACRLGVARRPRRLCEPQPAAAQLAVELAAQPARGGRLAWWRLAEAVEPREELVAEADAQRDHGLEGLDRARHRGGARVPLAERLLECRLGGRVDAQRAPVRGLEPAQQRHRRLQLLQHLQPDQEGVRVRVRLHRRRREQRDEGGARGVAVRRHGCRLAVAEGEQGTGELELVQRLRAARRLPALSRDVPRLGRETRDLAPLTQPPRGAERACAEPQPLRLAPPPLERALGAVLHLRRQAEQPQAAAEPELRLQPRSRRGRGGGGGAGHAKSALRRGGLLQRPRLQHDLVAAQRRPEAAVDLVLEHLLVD